MHPDEQKGETIPELDAKEVSHSDAENAKGGASMAPGTAPAPSPTLRPINPRAIIPCV